jgi:hypothetical protein
MGVQTFKNIYYTLWRWQDTVRGWPRDIKHFIQRGRRGYADCDTWGINHYLADIVPKMIRDMEKYHHGCPMDFFDEPTSSCDRWSKELIKYAEGWEAIGKVLNDEHITHTPLPKGETRKIGGEHGITVDFDSKFDEEQMNAWIKQFEDIGPSFFKNFLGLWD